jgi:3-phenylpropionate/trans-cinnamate dioxygenase ferredoxin reductase component
MAESPSFLIVGASLAGASAAAALREQGFEGQIILVGQEREVPNERPPLSKEYLRGESSQEAAQVHPAGFYSEQGIELRTATEVVALNARDRFVTLDDGAEIQYDKLLLSTGAEPRRASMPGAELAGTHYLRTTSDSDSLRARLTAGTRLVVIGGGWIGCEVAASAVSLGVSVTLVERSEAPLGQTLGAQLGAFYGKLHTERGVRVVTNASVTGLTGADRVEQVELTDGQAIEADLVLFGIGALPRVAIAAAAGLEVENGILADQRLETSVPGIFACGDVANAYHLRYQRRLRTEHWANARSQGAIAARAMLDKPAANDSVPYFFSDQYDVGMEYRGLGHLDDEVVFRGHPDSLEFLAFWVRHDRVEAAMNVNLWDAGETIERLIASKTPINRRHLSDPDVPLDGLLEGRSERPKSKRRERQ